jgi:hypothetical protein
MVRLSLLLAAILALAGCTSHCQELGDRLCQCRPTGTTTDSCQNAVKNDVQRANPGKDTEAECKKALDTCHPGQDAEGNTISFCDFLAGRCGKALCRISAESFCDPGVCADPGIFCNANICGASVAPPVEGTPGICDITACGESVACNAGICPQADQSPDCPAPTP